MDTGRVSGTRRGVEMKTENHGVSTTGTARGQFTILDTMLLVAMTAIVLAGAIRARFLFSLLRQAIAPWGWGTTALYGTAWLAQVMMLALIPIRLRHAGPPIKRLWRQPGWLACNAVVLALAITLLKYSMWFGISLVQQQKFSFPIILSSIIFQLPETATIAVAAGWATLALGGSWESEKGRIELLGKLFGLYLLVYPVIGWIMKILWGR
jgi:hypothetical protein